LNEKQIPQVVANNSKWKQRVESPEVIVLAK
jgi:hypothetical protein